MFAWALLGRSIVIVLGAVVIMFVVYWERRLQSERHWEVYARLLLASIAAAVLLAGRDVSQEYARSGKQFADGGPLKTAIGSWSATSSDTSAEHDNSPGQLTIDESTAQRVDWHVPDAAGFGASLLDERDSGATASQDAPDPYRLPSIDRPVPDGTAGSSAVSRRSDLTIDSDLSARPPASNSRLDLAEGVRASVREVPSSRTDMPYSLELTVRVSAIVQPFGLILTGDGVVDDLDFQVPGEGVYRMVLKGHIKGRPDQYYVGFESPAVSPQSPVVITLLAKHPIRISKIERAYIPYS